MICTNCKKRITVIWFTVLQCHDWCKRCFFELQPVLGDEFKRMMFDSAKPRDNMGKKRLKSLKLCYYCTDNVSYIYLNY